MHVLQIFAFFALNAFTRNDVIDRLNEIIFAPATRTIRGLTARERRSPGPGPVLCAAGVFVSTPSDLVRFGMAMNSGKLLKPATVELLQTPQLLPSGKQTDYGLGWYLKTVTLAGKQTRVTGHDGDSLGIAAGAGMVASLMTFPEYGIVVAVTSNISHAEAFALGMKIAEAFVEQGRIPARK